MLKLLKLAWKEIKLIKSQRIALALIIIYPVLVVFTLAIAFSGNELFSEYFGQTGLESVDLVIYLPPDADGFDSSDFWEKISGYEYVNLMRAQSPEKVREAIDSRVSRVGIVVNEPEDGNMHLDVDVYLDNSALLASKTIAGYAYMGLEKVRNQKSQEILGSIWEELGDIKSKLNEEKGKVDVFIEEMGTGKEKLLSLKEKINSIEIESLIADLNEFDSEYDEAKNDLASARIALAESKQDLQEQEAKLVSTRSKLFVYKQELTELRDEVIDAKEMAVGPIYTKLQEIEDELDDKIHEIDGAISDIDIALVKINETEVKLAETDASLVKGEQKLDKANNTVASFRETMELLDKTISETNALIDEALVSQELVEKDLGNTKNLVNSLIETLEEFEAYDPGFLVNPLNIAEIKMYDVDDLAIMTPISLALVLLLTTVLLSGISVLREREWGVNFRARLSPTTKPMWISGKILGQIAFAFFEASLIFAIVFLGFGIPLAGSPLDLIAAVAVVAFCFSVIGIFLTNFTKTESTLILSSLVLMLPMIFLSGIIFPLEFMPAVVKTVAELLPLTIAINIFTSIMVRGTPLVSNMLQVGVLLGISAVMLVVSFLKKEI